MPGIMRVVACVLALAAGAAWGQAYPSKPIKVVVPWPPGQATDTVARLVAQKLQESLGQPVIIDNRPGAGGAVGAEFAAKSAPDGYTLVAASSGPFSINPHLYKLPYDPLKDFVAIGPISTFPFVLVTHPGFPAANAKELIAAVKAAPEKYTFSTSGQGSTSHLVAEMFNSMAQLKPTHVPYKGSVPSLTDVMNGQVTFTFETVPTVMTNVKGGKLKAYGVSSLKPNSAMPEVPPIADAASLPGFEAFAWVGYMAPAGTPKEIVDRLNAEMQKAVQSPDVREKLTGLGMDGAVSNAADFQVFVRNEFNKFGAIVRNAGIKVE